MFRRCWRLRVSLVGLVVGVGMLVAGCLGLDYLDQPLSLTEWDHGWLGVIDREETLDVVLHENPSYPGVEWQIVAFDSSVLTLEEAFHAPPPQPEVPDDLQSLLATSVFVFAGSSFGESPLVLEIRADGEPVDLAEFTMAVVEDACTTDVGIYAVRCGDDRPEPEGQRWPTEWDHGNSLPVTLGEEMAVMLTANAVYPGVPWQVVEYDPSVIVVQSNGTGDVRTPGDWDLSDPDKPASFLPISEFVVTGVGSGESVLMFELLVGDQQVEVVEYTVEVAEDG